MKKEDLNKENIGKSVSWGIGAFNIIMKSKLVSIGCFLFTGILHVINPRGGLRWTAGMLAGFVALYALVSFILLLTNNNKTVAKGKEIAGGLVKGVIEGNRDPIVHGQELTSKNKKVSERKKETNSKLDERMQSLSEKQKKEPKAGRIVMCVFYAILFVGAVLLFFWSDVTITAVHIIVGALMIADGISSIIGTITAVKNGVPMKEKTFSLVAYSFSVVIGAAFILLSWSTADLTMVICGIVLILKGLTELYIIIRNREVVSSVKGTFSDIKNQSDNNSEKLSEDET